MNRADCIAELSRLTPEITGEEIADIFWLALHMGPLVQIPAAVRESGSSRGQQSPRDTRPPAQAVPVDPKPAIRSPDPSPAGDREFGLYALSRTRSAQGGLPVSLVRVAAAKPLRDAPALGRSLRTLKKRVPSRTVSVIDILATVDNIAEGGLLAPILRPARERWLDLAFVLDESVSMRTWDITLMALRRLLEHHGAFRRFQLWKIQPDAGTMTLYMDGPKSAQTRKPRPASELTDVSGRKLILIASDCVAEGWRNGDVFRHIEEWGKHSPVALLQMLPQRLWSATALGEPALSVRSRKSGAANSQLVEGVRRASRASGRFGRMERSSIGPAKPSFLLPVLNLEEWSFAGWSDLLTAKPDALVTGVDLVQILHRIDSDLQARTPEDRWSYSIQPQDRIEEFRTSASPLAYDLACYLAQTPLSLPVMRLVQQVMLPESTQTHMAEVVLGGLMKAVPEPLDGFEADAIMFEFYPGVDTQLRSYIIDRDRNLVLGAVSEYLAQREGGPRDFIAGNADGTGDVLVDPLSKAFGKIASQHSGGQWIPKGRWIHVVGSGLRDGLPQIVKDLASGIGNRLALEGYDLMIGEWPGVDYLTAQSYAETLSRLGIPVRGHLRQFVQTRWQADFPADRYGAQQITRDGSEWYGADAVILIGGAGTTKLIFEECMARNMAVLPIAGSGGDANIAYLSIAAGQKRSKVDRRLLTYIAQSETVNLTIDRTAVVLGLLHNPDAANIYSDWALALYLWFRANQPSEVQALSYVTELAEASQQGSRAAGPDVRRATPRQSRDFEDAPPALEVIAPSGEFIPMRADARPPALEALLPKALEWLRYDFVQLTSLASDEACWRMLGWLIPLLIKHLPLEAQTLIRAVCTSAGGRNPGDLLENSSNGVDASSIEHLLGQALGLGRQEFHLLLRLWRFSDEPESAFIGLMKNSRRFSAPDPAVIPLLANTDRLNRHLAFGAFAAYPLLGAVATLVRALEFERSDREGLSPLWAECISQGMLFEPDAYRNHAAILKAILEAPLRAGSEHDPAGGWQALAELGHGLPVQSPLDGRVLTPHHYQALLFMRGHILTGDEWKILHDLGNGIPITVAGGNFRARVRRMRDRQIIEGGRVSALERGQDLAKSFTLTRLGHLLLKAPEPTESPSQSTALLVFNLLSVPERIHLRKLAGEGSPHYVRSDTLVEELRRLRDLGLIVNSTPIGQLPQHGEFTKTLSLAPDGREYLALCQKYDVLDEPPLLDDMRGASADSVEFLLEHLLTRPQKLQLERLAFTGPAPYESTGDFNNLAKELRWLRSLGLIASSSPLHKMPAKGDLKLVVALTSEGQEYLDLQNLLRQPPVA
jgi:hypothetical protein